MRGIYSYVPETNHFSWAYGAAAVLYLQFVLHVMLFRTLNIFVLLHEYFAKYVQCPIWLFFVVP